MGPNLFQHDNTPLHRTRSMTTQFAKTPVSCTLPWPQPLWTPLGWTEMLGRLVQHHCLISRMLLWLNKHKSPQSHYQNLVESPPRRVKGVTAGKTISKLCSWFSEGIFKEAHPVILVRCPHSANHIMYKDAEVTKDVDLTYHLSDKEKYILVPIFLRVYNIFDQLLNYFPASILFESFDHELQLWYFLSISSSKSETVSLIPPFTSWQWWSTMLACSLVSLRWIFQHGILEKITTALSFHARIGGNLI